ncbi:hypothetical protein EJ05DRAFT_503021 [Pseudovirgaria hyperparasitica]|uniref:Uncharacterized protein n=1 Tax=Pseudovirgaria hyperparasitica TaxID=470096 RepID=A0A6A6W0Q4_9PEZI|nr:uncharacterized protein EJ05DRAFT_503021 [Pseudovirgaria hyperparasitica]KAF2755564.1 hypothetical protein EJ05DRAFT_503021 [Pseudovirgaria hyperparasitica]
MPCHCHAGRKVPQWPPGPGTVFTFSECEHVCGDVTCPAGDCITHENLRLHFVQAHEAEFLERGVIIADHELNLDTRELADVAPGIVDTVERVRRAERERGQSSKLAGQGYKVTKSSRPIAGQVGKKTKRAEDSVAERLSKMTLGGGEDATKHKEEGSKAVKTQAWALNPDSIEYDEEAGHGSATIVAAAGSEGIDESDIREAFRKLNIQKRREKLASGPRRMTTGRKAPAIKSSNVPVILVSHAEDAGADSEALGGISGPVGAEKPDFDEDDAEMEDV